MKIILMFVGLFVLLALAFYGGTIIHDHNVLTGISAMVGAIIGTSLVLILFSR